MPSTDRATRNCVQMEYRQRNRERLNAHTRTYYRRKRQEVIGRLGGRCIRCGFSDSRALQIDHINGGGSQEMKRLSFVQFWKRVQKVPEDYQLLCANCNQIKKSENNENRRPVPYGEANRAG